MLKMLDGKIEELEDSTFQFLCNKIHEKTIAAQEKEVLKANKKVSKKELASKLNLSNSDVDALKQIIADGNID